MIIGYARVSTNDQNPELQVDALEKAGAEQVFQEKFTGTSRERPELSQCLRMLRPGDVLVVWKLDRLARSLKDLVEIVQDLQCVFQTKVATDSRRSLPPIPRESCH